ncbi:MAG: lipid-A-disaccharide synthase [Bacteroidales bacterium]|nr:lipid-A-disaccharide synthase [Bacteroidales bacterium]
MKYYLIAGEASGDMHASLLMQGLLQRDPQADFRLWGSDKMEAVMGIVEVIAKAGRIRRNLAMCKADILAWCPDVVILVDYPGFNLKIARFAHDAGFKVFYYIAPKVWASRERRVEFLKRYVDKLFVIFPFEVEWFRSRGIEPVYEGNPLIDSIETALQAAPSREEFLRANGLEDKPIVALLPGSRLQEIKFLAPRFRELARDPRLSAFQFVIAGAPGLREDVYEKFFGSANQASADKEADASMGIRVVYGQAYSLLRHSAAAAVASGTASLEAAIIGTPQVVCYGMNPLSFKIAISILKVPYVSLANLIANKLIFKELLQDKCTPEAISEEILRLTGNADYRAAMLADYAAVRQAFGTPGAASRIASVMYDSVRR